MERTAEDRANARIVDRLMAPSEWQGVPVLNASPFFRGYHLLAASTYESLDGMLILGQEGPGEPIKVVHANNAAIQLLCAGTEEVPQLFCLQDVERALSMDGLLEREFRKENGYRGREQFATKDIGGRTIAVIGGERICATQRSWHRLLHLIDITEATAKERDRDEFFSITSHELRTPLEAINGCSKFVMESFGGIYPDPTVKSLLTEIFTSSSQLIAMVNDFLNMSRLEQGRFAYQVQQFDLGSLVEEVRRDLLPLFQERNMTLECSVPASCLAYADPGRSKQILVNLVGNALKFTKQGGVFLEISPERERAVVRVRDTGQGIPPDKQERLFKKFSQVANGMDAFTKDPNRSSGLGLYISRLMAEGMGCRVKLESSSLGAGSVFALSLPAFA